MALFVHLAPEKDGDSIRRTGIKPRRLKQPLCDGFDRIVFAMPVTNNFFASHQWLRELKRGGQRTMIGVYFRIPDDQRVMVGHYNQNHEVLSAAEAVGIVFNAEEPEGFEVIIPRKIDPTEIEKIDSLPQVMGWRYYPDAKGKKPCGCPYCTKGDIKSKRIRDAYQRSCER